MKLLSQLKIGESAIITGFKDSRIYLKLLEMGFIPGEKISIDKIAPLGCPLSIQVAGYNISIRKNEAASVMVQVS